MPRVFFALEIERTAAPVFLTMQAILRRNVRDKRVRWVREQQFYIAVHFVGEVSHETAQRLKGDLLLLSRQPIELTTWTLDIFPTKEYPRTIVSRLADLTSTAFQLHAALVPILLRAGLSVDVSPWNPHLVLAQVQPGGGAIHLHLEEIHDPQFSFFVHSVTLFETIPGLAVKYVPLASVELERP